MAGAALEADSASAHQCGVYPAYRRQTVRADGFDQGCGMSLIVNKRILGERIQAFIKNNDPDFDDMISVMDALSEVFTDQLQMPVKVSAKIMASDGAQT
jgi:hypothetical protein